MPSFPDQAGGRFTGPLLRGGLGDLATLLAHFGMLGNVSMLDRDLDGDGNVGLSDLATILTWSWGPCPP